jgi:hypothetical protein
VTNEGDLGKALAQSESIDDVSIIAARGLPKNKAVWEDLEKYCEDANHQNVFAILDSKAVVNDGASNDLDINQLITEGDALPRRSNYAAFYIPQLEVIDPAKRVQDEDAGRQVAPKYRGRTYVPPSGHMATCMPASTKARCSQGTANTSGSRRAIEVKLLHQQAEAGPAESRGVNCIRIMNGGVIVWGARTIGGDRTAVEIHQRGASPAPRVDRRRTQWVVFSRTIRRMGQDPLNVTAF